MKQYKKDGLWYKIDECGNIVGTSVRPFEGIEIIENEEPTPGPTEDPPDDF